jgi:ribonucleoside-diphosphate reductase alpha chain
MIKKVVKRDGSIEEFIPHKLNGWGEWAAKTLGNHVDWSFVVLETLTILPEVCDSQLLQERLIKTCLDQGTHEYNRMAGRLYAAYLNKKIFENGKHPTVKELHDKLYLMGLMVKLDYTDEEYAQVEKWIKHNRDFKATYAELHASNEKYAIRNRTTGTVYETQQFMYMRMAMALAEKRPAETRMNDLYNWYEAFSNKRLNAPSPNHINLGTPLNGYSSCCVYTTLDTAKSLAVGDHIAYTMTCMSAGIGNYLNCRSLGDAVRGGAIIHMGKSLPLW